MKTLLFPAFVLLSFSGCYTKFDTDRWYEKKVACIKADSARTIDSVYNEQLKYEFTRKYYYNKGKLVAKRFFRKDSTEKAAEFLYSRDGKWCFVKEYHLNGLPSFEGIRYNDRYYGRSLWYFPDGKILESGMRIADEHVGKWTEYDKNGKLKQEVDYGQEQRLDTLRKLDKCR